MDIRMLVVCLNIAFIDGDIVAFMIDVISYSKIDVAVMVFMIITILVLNHFYKEEVLELWERIKEKR